jgi:hypothetical protein
LKGETKMINGKQVEHDVRENILFGDKEALTYECEYAREFKVWTDTKDGENRILCMSYGCGDNAHTETIPWDVAFLEGVIAEEAEDVYREGDNLMFASELQYLGC